jgi:hypothetical protein
MPEAILAYHLTKSHIICRVYGLGIATGTYLHRPRKTEIETAAMILRRSAKLLNTIA